MCERVQEHRVFGSSSFNLLGLSQGSVLARHIIQHCDLGQHKVHRFLSAGGPNMGVSRQPSCVTSNILCQLVAFIESSFALLDTLQNWLAPAGYWRNTRNFIKY